MDEDLRVALLLRLRLLPVLPVDLVEARLARLMLLVLLLVVVVVLVFFIFVIIIVLNLMVGVAGGDVVWGTSSTVHHAVESDVSWVSCIAIRRWFASFTLLMGAPI